MNQIRALVENHRGIVACGIIIASSLLLLPAFGAQIQSDLDLYSALSDRIFTGALPYCDFDYGYPPYAIPLFLLPRVFGDGCYSEGFIGFAFAADWVVKLSLLSIGFRQSKTVRALLPLLLYCLAIPFTRFFFLQRYDVFPAVVCVAALWLFCSQRFFFCGLAIAVGAGLKLYPALFLAPLLILSFRHGRSKAFVCGVALGLLPWSALSLCLPWWRFAQFQSDRGLQVESLYASILWLGKLAGWCQLNWTFTKTWFEIQGAVATDWLPWTRALLAATVLASLMLTILAACRLVRPSLSQLAGILLLPLLAFVAFNQALSPQYLIWVLPLAALTVFEGNSWPALAVALATVLTPIIYPSIHGNYATGLDSFETTVLLLRNLILVGVWIGLFLGILRAVRRNSLAPSASHF
ncbi:MAG: glycosyltransferase family 87 protein [Verrucomicrobiae bacterium]|nr:glycosyltransferase family 87 protein [Verrucomicrobiae bacterium]